MANADWDLGQKLIEQGACSLDQVREILSLQDRLRKTGAISKPFERVLLERGYATRDQLLRAGVSERDLPPPVEEKIEPQTASKPGSSRRRAPQAFGVLALALVGVVTLVLVLRDPGEKDVPGAKPVGSEPVSEEVADQLLHRELEAIAILARSVSNFENAAEVVRRYEAFMKATAGRKWEVEAHRSKEAYCAKAEIVAKAELDDLAKGEAELRDQGRWKELLAHYRKFPATFLQVTEAGRSVRQKMQMEERRVGKECTSWCRSRWSPYH